MQNNYRKYVDFHKNENDIEYKKCQDCLKWFEMNSYNFGKNKGNKDGFNERCKECQNIYNHNQYMKNRELRIKQARQWTLDHPEKAKESWDKREAYPERQEYHRKHGKDQKASGYYAEYIQRPEVKARKYGDKHRNHEMSSKEWSNCKNYFKDKDGDQCCAYCGKKIQDHFTRYKGKIVSSDFHKEHKDNNGANDLSNCLPSCGDCNCGKWGFDFEEWYRKQDFFTEERYNKIIKWITEDYKLYIEEKLPYRVVRKLNEGGINKTFHQELWTIDEERNLIECIDIADHKKDLNYDLVRY